MSTLTDESFETLKTGVESILSDIGFVVDSRIILKEFENAGAHVDYSKRHVRLSARLLWELAGKAPGSYKVAGMNGDGYHIGAGGPYKFAIVTDPYIADYPAGAIRKPRLSDVICNTRIIQSQPDVCCVSLMDYPVEDFAGPASRYRALEAHLLSHAKPYGIYPTSYKSFTEWLEIGRIIKRGGPLKNTGLFSVAIPVLSPLTLTGGNCDILLEGVKHSFPLIPTVCPMAGSTSPYTFSGTLVQALAECLVVICAAQVMNPGNPILFALGATNS